MAIKYGRKIYRKNNALYTVINAILLCTVFLTMVSYFYSNAEEQAYENLHIQTKQIKDDMQLQLLSDRENLATMANFAAKLYSDGESYELLFTSFEPIGLIGNIGILNPDNTFVTKAGSLNLNGLISFEEEKAKGSYISGRVKDLTRDGLEIIRSAVPIISNGNTVGILYGVIKLDVLGKRYNNMAKELDAQLFVHEKKSGNLVIDTLNETLTNISFLKERKYNEGYSYEQMIQSDKGFTSFVSAYTGENLYVHYSTLDKIDWTITLARYESQVFAETHKITKILLLTFFVIVSIMFIYILIIMSNEKRGYSAISCASVVRKLLLEINHRHNNIFSALMHICVFAGSRSAFYFDADDKDYNYAPHVFENNLLVDKDRDYLKLELLRYAAEFHKMNNAALSFMCITPNKHLLKTNQEFYSFMKKHSIREISFAAVIDDNNYISILGTVNPKRSKATKILIEDVAVCFSIALFNKMHLNRTEIAATTDALTGALNRVAYKKDILVYDKEKPQNFSCIYIDVNELHYRNNKYGHAAGDEMLLYIANSLKEVFYGHKVYRMGGDEFLVFIGNTAQETIKHMLNTFVEQLEPMNYHVAIGMSFRSQNTNTEDMVREAEVRMYESKAQYYQNKEQKNTEKSDSNGYIQIKTGILEIDAILSILKEHYNGIYRVSLDSDKAHRILMPAYLGYNEKEEHFSALLNKYIGDSVNSDYHRSVMSFLNYDALKAQLMDGNTPKITYKKNNGEKVILSVYKLGDSDASVSDTLWVFAKE